MDTVNKTIQILAKEYLVEWLVKKDYLRKINRNNEKLTKYAKEAILREGADDYKDRLEMLLNMLQNILKLDLKYEMHRNKADQIRSSIIKLNPHKKYGSVTL